MAFDKHSPALARWLFMCLCTCIALILFPSLTDHAAMNFIMVYIGIGCTLLLMRYYFEN